MKNNKLFIAIFVLVCLIFSVILLCSCNTEKNEDPKTNVDERLDNIDINISQDNIDSSYNENTATVIRFSNNGVSIDGNGATDTGNDVSITKEGTFVLSGACSDGSVKIDAGKGSSVQIVLAGLELANSDGYAILITSGKKITITLADGTINKLSDGEGYTISEDGSNVDGAIFSKADLVFNGNGALLVNGNNAHGIVSKDGLTIASGSIEVNSTRVGICGKDFIKIASGSININAGSDALRSDNETNSDMGYIYIQDGSFNLVAVNDAIQAANVISIEGGSFTISTTSTISTDSAKAVKGGNAIKISGGTFVIDSEDDAIHSNGDVLISGGSFNITTGDDGVHTDDALEITGGEIIILQSYEGIEATNIYISGGYIEMTTRDDGLNAAGGNDSNTGVGGRPGGDMFVGGTGTLLISGGYIIMHNEGDGVDSNGTLEISGGVILVDGPSRAGNGSMDYDASAKITGGIIITMGMSDMAQNFTEATQGSMLVRFNGYGSAGTVLSVCDENGKVILAFTATKAFNSALFSSPEIEKGKTYSIYLDAEVNGLDKNGYAHNTTQTGGSLLGTIEMTDYIYGQGSGFPGGGAGGRPGGRPW